MAVFFLGTTLGMFGCALEDNSSSDSGDSPNSDVPSQVVQGGYFEYSERGNVIQSLSAQKMVRRDQSNSPSNPNPEWTVEDGFTLFIGGSKFSHNAKLSAKRGTYNEQTSHLEAWGDVVLVNEAGDKLFTDHLIWSHDSDMVKTHDPVEIHTKDGILRGQGMIADSQFERYEILQPSGSFDLGMTSEDETSKPTQ